MIEENKEKKLEEKKALELEQLEMKEQGVEIEIEQDIYELMKER